MSRFDVTAPTSEKRDAHAAFVNLPFVALHAAIVAIARVWSVGRFKLIRFPDEQLDTWEFFDLKNDPMELKSRFEDPEHAETIASLKSELKRLRRRYKVED